jgi:uncharacterized repeat protein (TIGR04076 family)
MAKVKITVVRKMHNNELYGDNPPVGFNVAPQCEKLEEGQEFIYDGEFPPGFCLSALSDIYRQITHLRLGGDCPWINEKGTTISCCTDAVRPVVFKLERLEE